MLCVHRCNVCTGCAHALFTYAQVWHSASLQEYWTLASPASQAEAKALGYTLVSTVGYIDPVPPGGALTPAQRAAAVAGYTYVLQVDW